MHSDVQQRMDEGLDLLDAGDAKGALKIAKELERKRFTGAFDLGAQAYAALNRKETAVQYLQRGVQTCGGPWLNWQLLGNYLSDLERYDEADDAYESALACDDPWKACVRMNQAIMWNRRGEHDRAIAQLRALDEPILDLQIKSSLVYALKEAGRADEAIALAEDLLARELDDPDDDDRIALANVAAEMAELQLAEGRSRQDVRRLLLDAIARYGPDQAGPLFATLRELDLRTSSKAKYMRLFLHGELTREAPPELASSTGYYVNYDVVADSKADALAMAQEIEDVCGFTNRLFIERVKVLRRRWSEPIGVYSRSGMFIYDEDA